MNTIPKQMKYKLYFSIAAFYRPQRSCGQGYVFTRVCDSVHGGGSPENPLPGPGRHPLAGRTPRDQADPPRPGRTPPEQGDPLDQGDSSGTRQTPPGTRQTPPPGRRLQHTVIERPVRILLECILVLIFKFLCLV